MESALMLRVRALYAQLTDGALSPFRCPATFLQQSVRVQGATAVIAYDHRVAVELLSAAAALGLRIPHDFSINCFNDVFPMAAVTPGLTTVQIPGHFIGCTAAQRALNMMGGGAPGEVELVKAPEKLIVRESTGPMPQSKRW